MKRERNPKPWRQTGHWLTDALYAIPREHGTNITKASDEIFGDPRKGGALSRGAIAYALHDLDRYFAAFGYEIELVKTSEK